MENTNQIGLDTKQESALAGKLNELLANYQLFYTNTRGLHWNIAGDKFFTLHVKYEELYTDALIKIDEIAERVLTIGSTPKHRFTDYVAAAAIKESDKITDGRQGVQLVLDSYKILLELEREIRHLAGAADDEGTDAMMSDYIREQEKTVWMYTAFLK